VTFDDLILGGAEAVEDSRARLNAELVADVRGRAGIVPSSVRRRAGALMTRSIKKESQAAMLDLIIGCVDLTTLEGIDTRERIKRLVLKGINPDSEDVGCPSVGAICVEPDRVGMAREVLDAHGGGHVGLASVAWAFPAGRTTRDLAVAEIEKCVAVGASEIDIVIDRAKVLSGDWLGVVVDVALAKTACGEAHLKVILETGELGSMEMIAVASWLAIMGGADFIKTSTGKVSVGATPEALLIMARIAKRAEGELGRSIGIKASGGVSSAATALRYGLLVEETRGAGSVTPETFRVGASSLLNDLVAQRRHLMLGRYFDTDSFSVA